MLTVCEVQQAPLDPDAVVPPRHRLKLLQPLAQELPRRVALRDDGPASDAVEPVTLAARERGAGRSRSALQGLCPASLARRDGLPGCL
jgi:hypothetical protein